MQFEAAKTQAIRSKATAKRPAHDEIGALDTAPMQCGRRALGAVREADSFVPEPNKVQATRFPARSRTLTLRWLLAFVPKIKRMGWPVPQGSLRKD